MNIRQLEEGDYDLGYLDLLNDLTTIGMVNKEQWLERFREIKNSNMIEIWVIHDKSSNKIIGTATLLVEPKFIHRCGLVGHIEDVVIRKHIHGGGLGKKLIGLLMERSILRGCYKTILDCGEHNVGFYQKCGFSIKGREMARYSKL